MPFITFMASSKGRLTRVLAGAALVLAGGLLGGPWLALAAVGLVPLVAGALDLCVFAPLFRLPLSGPRIRDRAAR